MRWKSCRRKSEQAEEPKAFQPQPLLPRGQQISLLAAVPGPCTPVSLHPEVSSRLGAVPVHPRVMNSSCGGMCIWKRNILLTSGDLLLLLRPIMSYIYSLLLFPIPSVRSCVLPSYLWFICPDLLSTTRKMHVLSTPSFFLFSLHQPFH